MIKNIIFDMGNVIIYTGFAKFLDRFDLEAEDRALLMREVFLSTEWSDMDWGIKTDAEAAESICKHVPERLHDTVHKLVSQWDRPILEVPGMCDLVRELKENGYSIYLLSNASVRHPEYWQRVPAAKYFDGTLISANVKIVKPLPEIYRLLCDTFSLTPEECFFIDDVNLNVVGAKLCGFAGMVFHDDVKEVREKLIAAGVEVAQA